MWNLCPHSVVAQCVLSGIRHIAQIILLRIFFCIGPFVQEGAELERVLLKHEMCFVHQVLVVVLFCKHLVPDFLLGLDLFGQVWIGFEQVRGTDHQLGTVAMLVGKYDPDTLVPWTPVSDVLLCLDLCTFRWVIKVVEVVDDVVDVPHRDILGKELWFFFFLCALAHPSLLIAHDHQKFVFQHFVVLLVLECAYDFKDDGAFAVRLIPGAFGDDGLLLFGDGNVADRKPGVFVGGV